MRCHNYQYLVIFTIITVITFTISANVLFLFIHTSTRIYMRIYIQLYVCVTSKDTVNSLYTSCHVDSIYSVLFSTRHYIGCSYPFISTIHVYVYNQVYTDELAPQFSHPLLYVYIDTNMYAYVSIHLYVYIPKHVHFELPI